MIVYKSVEVLRNGARVSAFCCKRKRLQVCYLKDKEVAPKVGKCFAFDSLDNAKSFIWGSEIWKAETPRVETPPARIYCSIHAITENLKGFWASLRTTGVFMLSLPPRGTVLCPSLKLIKRVAIRSPFPSGWQDI